MGVIHVTRKLWPCLVLFVSCADVTNRHTDSSSTVIMASDSRGSLMIRHQRHPIVFPKSHEVMDDYPAASAQAVTIGDTSLPAPVAIQQNGHNALSKSICLLAVFAVCSATLRLATRGHREEPLDLLSTILLCAAYVAIASASDILVKWEAQTHAGILPFAPARMVFVVEVMKLCLTSPLVLMRHANNSFRFPSQAECYEALRLMTMPAVSYSLNNALIFFIVGHVDFSSLSVWRQLTPIFVAFIWVLVFGRHLGRQRWFAIGLLVAGTSLNTCTNGGGILFNSIVLVVLLSCLTSAVAGVANEYALKKCGSLDIDFLCTLLYIQTSVFSLFLVVACESPTLMSLVGSNGQLAAPWTLLGGPPLSQDALPLAIVLLQVLFGFAVARVVCYLGAVPRAIVNATKELTVVIVAPAFIDSKLNGIIVASAVVVGVAVACFTLAPAPELKAQALGKVWKPQKDRLAECASRGDS